MLQAVSAKPKLRVMGFDPGSITFGIAVMDIAMKRKKPVCIAIETVNAAKLFKPSLNKHYIAIRGERDLRVGLIKEELRRLILKWKPDVVISEAPFLKRAAVTTFEALIEVRAMIRAVVWEIDPNIKVIFIDPIRVKNYIGVSHIKTDKSDMLKAVNAFYGDKQKGNVLATADEHGIDALAVCHVYYRRDVLGDVIEPSKKKRGKRASKRTPSGKSGQKSCGGSGRQRRDRNGGDTPRRGTAAADHSK